MRPPVLVIALVLLATAISSCGSTTTSNTTTTSATPTAAEPKADSAAVNRSTRRYAKAVNACRLSAGIVRDAAVKGDLDLIDMADLATTARDTCENVRANLVTMDTNHFDDQAAQAWAGVDGIKSGLNALLAYIDNPRPGKIIEARNKLNEGESTAHDGVHQINQRRHVYGLKAIT